MRSPARSATPTSPNTGGGSTRPIPCALPARCCFPSSASSRWRSAEPYSIAVQNNRISSRILGAAPPFTVTGMRLRNCKRTAKINFSGRNSRTSDVHALRISLCAHAIFREPAGPRRLSLLWWGFGRNAHPTVTVQGGGRKLFWDVPFHGVGPSFSRGCHEFAKPIRVRAEDREAVVHPSLPERIHFPTGSACLRRPARTTEMPLLNHDSD